MSGITVVGAGFAGLSALSRLRDRDREVELTLVAPAAELQYLPGIIWIPSGLRRREDLVVPLENFLRRQRIRFHAGSAVGLSADGRRLRTTTGDVDNEGLVIATGGRFLKKLPGIEHAITPCEGVDAAERIRDRLAAMSGGTIAIGFASNPDEPSSMRGGPMFEFLFGIDTQLRREGRRGHFELVFFSPATEPGNRLGARAVERLLAEMKRRRIVTHLGQKLVRFDPDQVITAGGAFAADLVLFMPGLTGSAWLDGTSLPRSPGGLLLADAHCRVAGVERVYAAGDGGSFPGPDWMPKQAHMADLQGLTAADNLLAERRCEAPAATFQAELACIVDSLDAGMLVVRTPTRQLSLPPTRLLHWAKRAFEHRYLRRYR